MATISEALAIAIRHHQGGRPLVAAQIYRQILQVDPNHAEATHLLGLVAHHAGKLDEAIAFYRRALILKPGLAEAHNDLGVAMREQGKPGEAIACCRRAAELKPGYVEPRYNLGNMLREQGKTDEAVDFFRRTLELKPDFPDAHLNLGVVLKDQGKLDEAAACCRRAMELKPDLAQAHGNLGVVLKEQGKLDEAMASWRRALELKPDYVAAHNNLGVAFKEQGKLDEAVACYRRALELAPAHAEAHNNLGVALKEQGKLDEAVACCLCAVELKADYAEAHANLGIVFTEQGKLDEAVACSRKAIQLKPEFAVAHNNLGNAFKEQGKLEEAAGCYRRAWELKPDYAEACNNLGNVLKDQGRPDDAIACYRQALELKPDYAAAHSNLLFAAQYCDGVTPAALAEAHAQYDRRHAAPHASPRWAAEFVANRPDGPGDPSGAPDQQILGQSPRRCGEKRRDRLRLGFVSADLGRHPVGYFLVRVLENIDRREFETTCYSDRMLKDDLTRRLQSAATRWCDVAGAGDHQLAAQIRADRIDILFDLAGHTAHNRLLVFARKPAAIQVTWAGYVGTTGLTAMDYLLADRHEVPPGAEPHYRERVLRMPDGYICYDPPAYAPPVGPLPALDHGQVTFGCFNNPAKITPRAIEVWARILRRLPQARLALKFKGWDDSGVRRRYAHLFTAQGVDSNRVEFLGCSPHAELLAQYGRIDLALDPFPYSGGLTTCEALWMGVPVVTCPGETFASRHSLSHLSNVGLTETIARNLDEYVELAVATAADLPRLAALRAGLRQRMAVSPLCDGKRFATNFASILRGL